ncbi:MAG: site-specific integrase [Acutalibacteraceae bacterium]|nr:site-specific integrase [Acutalibacteraceae bacterium]
MPKYNFTKRSDGRYQTKVYIGTKNDKKQYKYVYASTVKELDKKVQQIRIQLGKGLDLSADRDTFGYWGERWLKLKKIEVSSKRYEAYASRFANLTPIHNISITKLKAADIQDIILECAAVPCERTGKPYAKHTLTEIRNTAKQIINLAIENRVLDYNCASAVKIPKAATVSTRRALTPEEQQWIIDTPHRAQTAAMIMMYAGLRRGELLALTWQDIDLSARTITVNKSVEMINGKPHIKHGGKTEAATRIIYIPGKLANYLKNIAHPPIGLVCPTVKGTPMTDTAWKRLWESYLTDLNLKYGTWEDCFQTNGKAPNKYAPTKKPFIIPKITPHWLRHTFITMLYMAGVDVLTAKEQAGHSDIKTTMAIYTHLDEKHKKKNVQKLDDYLESLA